ncbi:UNVERIFIED_CONTAM: hypothetical protein K2H54_039464, partial [Gekko kuhli]
DEASDMAFPLTTAFMASHTISDDTPQDKLCLKYSLTSLSISAQANGLNKRDLLKDHWKWVGDSVCNTSCPSTQAWSDNVRMPMSVVWIWCISELETNKKSIL